MTLASPPNQTPNPIKKVTRSDGNFLLALDKNYSDYKATVEFVDGRIYEGPIVKGQLEGDGQMIWSDGKTYEGRFVAGVIDGKGKLIWLSGVTYEGNFCTDHNMTGKGNFIYSDTGDNYDGTITGGKPDGDGIYTFHSNNSVYVGPIRDGKFNGIGTLAKANGDVYNGEFVNGRRTRGGRNNKKNGRCL